MVDVAVAVRGAVALVVGWIAGVAWHLQSAELPATPHLVARLVGVLVLLALGVMVGLLRARLRVRWRVMVRATVPPPSRQGHPWRRHRLVLVGGLLGALVGHDLAAWRTSLRLAERLPHVLEGRVLMVQGVVQSLPRRQPQGVQFVFEVEAVHSLGGAPVGGVPRLVSVGWWQERHPAAGEGGVGPQPRPGERWHLPLVFKRPHGTLNPFGFDAERWFLEQGLGASGQVPAAHRGRARLIGWGSPTWRTPEAWRALLRDRIDAAVPDARLAGLIAGLTIGDQAAVEAEDWALFRDAGVAHVLAISGLHVTMFAAMAAPLIAALWRRSPRACLLVPAPWAGALGGWLAAVAYALLAGWGLPAQRTVAMLAVATGARLLSLHWPVLLVWILAAAPVVMLDPWAVGQASFWLSFAAVGLLMFSGSAPPIDRADAPSRRAAVMAWLRESLRQQGVASVGLAPLAALCFHQVSVVGVVANLVAVPWITLLVTPVALIGLWWPPAWDLMPVLLWPLRGLLEILVDWPWAVASVPASHQAWGLLALVGVSLAVMRLPWRLRVAGLVLAVPLMVPVPVDIPMGRFEAWGLDVGQGSAVLVRTRGHALLMDAGPGGMAGRADAGARIVVPALRALGVRHLDRLVVSHRDADHAGGVNEVLKGVPVRHLSGSLEPAHPLRQRGLPWSSCLAGQTWFWDGVRFEVLHPAEDLSHTPRGVLKPNTLSCVLRVEDVLGRSLLITADIEAAQEADLMRRPRAGGWDSTALVVPHHGSRTSSTIGFIEGVRPRWALVQAGHRNAYGHPSPEVMSRYDARGVRVEVSPWCGAWHWPSDGAPGCWRERARRHWHERPPP